MSSERTKKKPRNSVRVCGWGRGIKWISKCSVSRAEKNIDVLLWKNGRHVLYLSTSHRRTWLWVFYLATFKKCSWGWMSTSTCGTPLVIEPSKGISKFTLLALWFACFLWMNQVCEIAFDSNCEVKLGRQKLFAGSRIAIFVFSCRESYFCLIQNDCVTGNNMWNKLFFVK